MASYLIFGASGKTGSHLAAHLIHSGYGVITPSRKECDLTQMKQVDDFIEQSAAECVVNCAAVSGIESCLDDPVTAHYVNAMAPEVMANACRREGKRFLHLSTDYVLDGRREGLKDESAKCKPVNTYGESKWEAEIRILESMPGALIARVSWIFGHPSKPSFPETILARAIHGDPISAIEDKDSMPTWLGDLCPWLERLSLMPEISGILHLCQSGEPMSWHRYAETTLRAAVECGLLDQIPPVAKQRLDEQAGFRDARPKHTAMNSSRLASILGEKIRTHEESITLAVRALADQLKHS